MFKKVKRIELLGHICAVVATERFERMDILSCQIDVSVKYSHYRPTTTIYWKSWIWILTKTKFQEISETKNFKRFMILRFEMLIKDLNLKLQITMIYK